MAARAFPHFILFNKMHWVNYCLLLFSNTILHIHTHTDTHPRLICMTTLQRYTKTHCTTTIHTQSTNDDYNNNHTHTKHKWWSQLSFSSKPLCIKQLKNGFYDSELLNLRSWYIAQNFIAMTSGWLRSFILFVLGCHCICL